MMPGNTPAQVLTGVCPGVSCCQYRDMGDLVDPVPGEHE